MLKKVAVALDGSKHSEKAFRFACDLALKFDSTLYLLYVVAEREIPEGLERMAEIEHLIPARLQAEVSAQGGDAGYGSVIKNVERRGQAYRILEKLGDNLVESCLIDAKAKGIDSVVKVLLEGEPAAEMIRYLKEEKMDAVICGRRGLGGLRGMLVGSVSQKLSQHAPCASIIVK